MTNHSLRPMTESDLEQVLQWRNHPEVRRYMYTTHEIRLEEHSKWFMNATTNPAIELL
ncbi:GNAT family N-acetyltransferase [Marinobacter shengliensis]|uniref:GNAT family N-acetyltransferase n=1 Tax=Marinobacter shengliensis TaxID=1389223 RepID=UPI001E3A4F79|nr:GNAT family N-acetyltransferase [Marinobacter shengliensis]